MTDSREQADIAAVMAENRELKTENEWLKSMGKEVHLIRSALRAIVPDIRCDGVDLPGAVGTRMQELVAENESLRKALQMIRTHRANGEAQILSGREAQIYRWRRMGDIAIAALDGGE